MIYNQEFIWWIGVVEDRFDPLKLGRYRVRIWGYHSKDPGDLPIASLPWAITMHPSLSAANSGIGHTPLGLMQGSWVFGFFLDGEDKQQPCIVGAFGGIPRPENTRTPQRIDMTAGGSGNGQPPPSFESEVRHSIKDEDPDINILRTSDGELVYDGEGNLIEVMSEKTDDPIITTTLPPLSEDQIKKLMDAIGQRESGSVPGGKQDYSAENQYGFIGKYQFGAPALVDLGYVKQAQGKRTTNKDLNNPAVWTGKGGATSKDAFKTSPKVQEQVMYSYMIQNYNTLIRNGTISKNDPPERVAGLLSVSHLLGAGGARDFANGINGMDANGTTGRSYYSTGANAVRGNNPSSSTIPENDEVRKNNPSAPTPAESPKPITQKNPAQPLNNPSEHTYRTFIDPDNVYPKYDYVGRPDVHKLATGQSDLTAVETKNENLVMDIPTADDIPWDEPSSPWASTYPYNQVFETEAGHMMEFDSTPFHERIHIWHRSGSYLEIDVNGTSVRKVKGTNYEIIEKDNNVYVKGALNITADGVTNILVRDNVNLRVHGKTSVEINDDLDIRVAGDFNMAVGGVSRFRSEGSFDVQGSTINMDADTDIYMNSGTSGKPSVTPPDVIGGTNKRFGVLYRPEKLEEPFLFDAGEPGAEEFHNKQVEEGKVKEIEAMPGEEDDTPAKEEENQERVEISCSDMQEIQNFTPNIKLSKYFTLGDLSTHTVVSKYAIREQRGLSKPEIACNLKNLAVNALDKIKERFPDMIITSGFRPPSGGTAGRSDHEVGAAADLQFTRANATEYYEIARWIRDNVSYDQLLLEYGGGARNPWIHIALGGNKNPSMRLGTMKDHKTYAANKLVNLA